MTETELVIVGADGTPVGEDPGCRRRSGCCPLRDTVPFPDMEIPLAVGRSARCDSSTRCSLVTAGS